MAREQAGYGAARPGLREDVLGPLAAGAAAAALVGILEAVLGLATGAASPGLDLGVLTWAARAYALAGGAVGLALPFVSRAVGRLAGRPVFVRLAPGSPNPGRAALQAWFVCQLFGWCAFVGATHLARRAGLGTFPIDCLAPALALAWIAARLFVPRVCRGRGPGLIILALTLVLLEVAMSLVPAILGPLVWSVDELPRRAAVLYGDAGPEVGGLREASGPPTHLRPDVIVVTLDTTRADHLSTYGYERETSPCLTRLAADGLRFERAVSASSWTLPTHASMFTGLFPRSHGARFHTQPVGGPPDPLTHESSTAQPLDPAHTTMAEILRAKGYRTGGFVAGPYLYAAYGVAQGFDWYDDRIFVSVGQRLTLFTWLARIYRHAETDLADFDLGYRRAADLNESVFEWLDGQGDERVFLFVNYFDAHGPLRPVREMRDLFPGSELPITRHDVERVYKRVMSGKGTVPDGVRRWMVSQYDAEIRYQDGELGALLDRLQRDGRYDEALIIVLADHGEHLGEDGLIGHGFTLNEPVTHVPLIVKLPRHDGLAPGVRDELVHQVDLLPTVLARLGIDPAEFSLSLPGGSLLDPRASHRAFSELYPDPHRFETFGLRWRREVVGWASGDNHLVVATPTTATGLPMEEATERELFGSIGCGPEGPPLADPERMRELEGELAAWLETIPIHTPSKWLLERGVDGGAAAALGAVGYAGN